MIDKLKRIDNSRKDLQSILETKGVDLTNSNKSLDSLISNVGQLSLNNEVNPDTWDGVIEQDDPGVYWKGDEDWGSVIDIDGIMEADTQEYTGKAFFLIRCSDNAVLDDAPDGYTARGIVGFQAFRFSDQDDLTALSTTTSHHFDKTKDIIAPNGEHFRWIIGYTNSTTAVTLWQTKYLLPEAVVYWSGTYRGICFEDAGYNHTDGRYYYYSSGTTEAYYSDFSITNYNRDYTACEAPRYFEVKDEVDTQFIIGNMAGRADYAHDNYRTRTIIIDGYCRCEFMRRIARNCNYIRSTKPGYGKRLYLSAHDNCAPGTLYCYVNVSGCNGTIQANFTNGYMRLIGDTLATVTFNMIENGNILCDGIGTMGDIAQSSNSNFECGDIRYSVNASAFKDFDGYIKFGKIGRNIGNFAFVNCKHMPTEVIVERPEGDTTTHTMGYGAFTNTNVEKIDLINSGITGFSTYSDSDPNAIPGNVNDAMPFYGAKKLKILHLPKNMTTIKAYNLARLQALTTVTLPDNLVTIGARAFYDCSMLESVSPIPATLQSLGDHAFADCRRLKSLEINSDTLTSLPEGLCASCISLEKVTIPSKITTINASAFQYCRSLKNFTLPNSVLYLGQTVFQYCKQLKSIQYEDPSVGTMMNINQYCFQGCHDLEEIFSLEHITRSC